MVAPRVTVEGVKPLKRDLRWAKDQALTQAFKAAGGEGAKTVATTAAQIVPVGKTGNLRTSIRSSGTMGGGVVRSGSAKVPYAGPVHFGWPARGIEPRPFLYEAADQRAEEVTDLYYRRIQDITDEIARRSTISEQ